MILKMLVWQPRDACLVRNIDMKTFSL